MPILFGYVPDKGWAVVFPSRTSDVLDLCPPDVANNFREAFSSLNVGNVRAAVVVTRTALQAAMRDHQAQGKSLRDEIDDLVARHVIPKSLGAWAHEVRAGGNLAAHPDPGGVISMQDAEDFVGLAESIFEYLYAIPGRIAQRKARAALAATTPATPAPTSST